MSAIFKVVALVCDNLVANSKGGEVPLAFVVLSEAATARVGNDRAKIEEIKTSIKKVSNFLLYRQFLNRHANSVNSTSRPIRSTTSIWLVESRLFQRFLPPLVGSCCVEFYATERGRLERLSLDFKLPLFGSRAPI